MTAPNNTSEQLAASPSHLALLISMTSTSAACFFSFALAIHQPIGARRWLCLPAVLSGPAVHAFGLSRRALFPSSFLLWIWTFTVVVWTLHATSVLYIEKSVPSRPVTGGWNWLAVRKGWNNPRRIVATTTSTAEYSSSQLLTPRARFALVRISTVLVLATITAVSFVICIFTLKIRPRDLDAPVYISFSLDRAGLIRAISVIQWAWGCYCILTTAHFATSVVFVSILGVDLPEDWPPLWGDIRASISIRAFWSSFWHRIGTASQLSYARLLVRMLGLRQGSGPAKALTALCVFVLSGLTHTMANWAVSGGFGVGQEALFRDAVFLLLNSAGGLAETLTGKIFHVISSGLALGTLAGQSRLSMRCLGFAWVFVFFYCIVPPYQYPFLQQALKGFMPDIRISTQQGPFLKSMGWEEYHRLHKALK